MFSISDKNFRQEMLNFCHEQPVEAVDLHGEGP